MPKVVGIKFDGTAKIYWFAAGDYSYNEDDKVIVETARGVEMGTVKMLPCDVDDGRVSKPLKEIMRIATPDDIKRMKENADKIGSVMSVAEQKVKDRKIAMKLVSAQYTADGSKLIFCFTAPGRVDFRELVKDLASAFHIRIELRQIGERDECKVMGGFGMCGRQCCCSQGCDFPKVNIKMAKNQNLSLNPQKISGVCGRLMCCLAYENEYYVATNKQMPKVGASVKVNGEDGTVVGINQLKLTVRVKTETRDGFEINDYPLDSISKLDQRSAADDLEADINVPDELKNIQD